jgi:hypothetical protein
MATQTSGINQTLPPVSYTKALDVWTGVCLTFVFGALLEFALVNYASRSDQHRENVKKQRRQWELEQAAALDAAAAVTGNGDVEDGNGAMFGMVSVSISTFLNSAYILLKLIRNFYFISEADN